MLPVKTILLGFALPDYSSSFSVPTLSKTVSLMVLAFGEPNLVSLLTTWAKFKPN